MSTHTRRIVLAVVLGYAFLFVFTMLTFSLALVAPDFAWRAGGTEVTPAFTAYTLLMGFAGAFAAGRIAARLARERSALAVRILAVVVLVLGLGNVIAQAGREPRPAAQQPATAIAEQSPMQRAMSGKEPLWYSLVVPAIAVAGVFAGGRRRAPSERHGILGAASHAL